MTHNGLSLCMIVKDEEQGIARCLESVKDVVDEMIVVDTGSRDHTREVCRSYGARIFDFPWNGSFSDARNFSLERAEGDWILWLDADEEVEARDRFRLRDVLHMEEDRYLASVRLINYYGDAPNPDEAVLVAHHRLIRNGTGFRFMYRIHEMLNIEEMMGKWNIAGDPELLPVDVHHYGYLDRAVEARNKFERNMSLLEKEIVNPARHPMIDYYVASEYYNVGQYERAFEYVNRSILRFLELKKIPHSLLYKLKYSILQALGHIDGGWPAIERAIELYPDYVDLHFIKGVFLFEKKRYREALETFEHCLEMGEENLRHVTTKGVGSFQAWFYKGKCMEHTGDVRGAGACFQRAIETSVSYKEAEEALRKLKKK